MATKARNSKSSTATPSEAITAGAEFVREHLEKSMSGYGTFADMSRDAMDAWVRSATAARKGFEEINSENLAFSRQYVEEAVSTVKAAMTVKSVEEYYTLQSDYTRTALDSCVNQSSKMGEMLADTMREVWEPFQGQFQSMVTTAQKQTATAA